MATRPPAAPGEVITLSTMALRPAQRAARSAAAVAQGTAARAPRRRYATMAAAAMRTAKRARPWRAPRVIAGARSSTVDVSHRPSATDAAAAIAAWAITSGAW